MLSLSVVRGARYLRSSFLSSRKARGARFLAQVVSDETREIRHGEKRACRVKSPLANIWSRRARVFSRNLSRVLLAVAVCLITFASALSGTGDDKIPNCVAGKLIQLNDNGAWSWFMDPRVTVDNGKLIVGSVRAIGAFHYRRSRSTLG